MRFEREEPRLVRVRTFVLLLLAATVLGGAAAEISNAIDRLPVAAGPEQPPVAP